MKSLIAIVGACLLLAGCATGPGSRAGGRDPFESVNRAVFSFNDTFDRHLAQPVARAWVDYVPSTLRTGVRNFLGNFDDLLIGANNLLQGKVYEGTSDFMRFVINSTFGLAGLLDVASEARLEKHNEDLGQTLATWGVPDGPYLVLPFLGPSTVRDAPSTALTYVSYPLRPAARAVDSGTWRAPFNTATGLYLVETRAELLQAGSILDNAALDRYRFVRDAFIQRRHSLIHDGNPPPTTPAEDDEDDVLAPGSPVMAKVDDNAGPSTAPSGDQP